jgi:hypothetical protein
MIERQTVSRWKAAAGIWAHFIKPSLLVADADGTLPAVAYSGTLNWTQGALSCALVIELPALESVAIGVVLAREGWSVIPMFNTTVGTAELLPTSELTLALRAAALELPGKVEGPPAFLLDANRQISSKRFIESGDFDNRWYVFESDFPSEGFLAAQGINSLVVVTHDRWIADDLRDALAGYQQIGRRLLNPVTGLLHSYPTARSKIFRLLSTFLRGVKRNTDGTFGRRKVASHG